MRDINVSMMVWLSGQWLVQSTAVLLHPSPPPLPPFFRRFPPLLDPHPSNPRRSLSPLISIQCPFKLLFDTQPLSLSSPSSPSTILFSNSISKSPLRKTQPADCVSDPPGGDLVFDLARSWGNFLVYAYETRIYIYSRHNTLVIMLDV